MTDLPTRGTTTPRTKRLKKAYTSIRRRGGRYAAYLNVGVQHFRVADADTEAEADWYRDQLAHALSVLLDLEAGKPGKAER